MNYFNKEIKPNATLYEKRKNNFARQIAIMDYRDTFYGSYRDSDKLKLYKINYDLMNGRLDTDLYKTEDECKILGETIQIKQGEIPHIPLISQVTNTLRGEYFHRPWKLTIEDNSPLKSTIEGEEYLRLLKDYVQNNIIKPNEQKALDGFMQQFEGQDPALLTPEDMTAMQEQIGADAQALNPQEIVEFMSNDYQNPITKQAKELMDFLDKELEIHNKTVEAFTHMLPTAEVVYYANASDIGPEFESVPPDSITYGGPIEKEYLQDMDWIKREKWTTVQDVKFRYAEVLKKEHIEELDKMYEPLFGTPYYQDQTMQERLYQHEFANRPGEITEMFGNQDWKKKENFKNILKAQEYISSNYPDANYSDFAIRETHFVWRDERVMYRVFRAQDGKIKKYYFSENYEPTIEDIEVKRIIVPEIWEGTKLGTEDPIYVNIRPLKYQYTDLDNPYKVTMPYIGKKFNTYKNRSKNVTVIDIMKQFNRDYDTQMAELRRDLRTNIGKVFVTYINAKPEKMTWSDMITMARDFNMLLIDPNQKGAQIDPTLMKQVDMGKMSEIAERIQLLDKIQNDLFSIVGFNQHRTGQGSQYATNGNIASQQAASYNQTEVIFETFRDVTEKAINRLMNVSRLYYKENPDKLKHILSPSSMAELEFGYPFWYSHFSIRVDSSGRTARQVEVLKQYLNAFIQNGMSPKDVIELALAETKNDLVDIVSKIDRKNEEQINAAKEAQMQQLQMQMQESAAIREEDRQFKIQLAQMENQASIERTQYDMQKFALAQDIDHNNKSDLLQSKELEMKFKAEELNRKMELEYEKLNKQ